MPLVPSQMAEISQEGRRAFVRGEPISACPYERGDARVLWREGWRQAKRKVDSGCGTEGEVLR